MNKINTPVSCIILAGGEGKRVGGVDKGLLKYKNKALIEHVLAAAKPQIDDLVISANRNIERYQHYSNKVISDESQHYRGPLAGIDAALTHCKHDWVLILPCDTPFLPKNIIDIFFASQTKVNLYIAESNNKMQPVMLIHKTLHNSISLSLKNNQLRLMHWVKSQQPAVINFKDTSAFKSFNKSEDFNA